VLQFDGPSGALIGDFVTAADNGGMSEPRAIAFTPDGRLLVASMLTDQVLEFDRQTGAFIRQFNDGGSADRLTLDEPWGVRLGIDGDVYISRHGTFAAQPLGGGHLHLTEARIYQFDVVTGRFVRAYVIGNDTGLDGPTGFDFMPNDAVDCNFNLIQDSCDLASGFSSDSNGNSIPDECECPADADGDGDIDISDLGVVLAQFGSSGVGLAGDLDSDGDVDISDLGLVLANFGSPCG
jgi:hypothetical protein